MGNRKEQTMEGKVYELLRTVVDPELGVNVVDLGFVYQVQVTSDHTSGRAGKIQVARVRIRMTLTTPGCPLGSWFVQQIKSVVGGGLKIDEDEVMVEVVFEPPWSPEAMSEEAKAQLGWE